MAVPTRWAVDGLDAMTWRGLDAMEAAPAMGVQLAFALVFGVAGGVEVQRSKSRRPRAGGDPFSVR